MAVFGQAGTGKSEVMRAAIWYAFQYGIPGYIATTSYMWRAALMMHKPHTPGCSVCSFFGINKYRPHLQPGSGEKTQQLFHGDVRMLFLEEGGTIDLACLEVCVVLYD